jgi:hypothetical protein
VLLEIQRNDMPNKNDKSDLIQFFGVGFGIIFGLAWLLSFGYTQAEKRYGGEVKKIDAKISKYVWREWQEVAK